MMINFNIKPLVRTCTATSVLLAASSLCSCNKLLGPKEDTFEPPKTFVCRETDNIDKLAARFNTTKEEFLQYSGLQDEFIKTGDSIRVPHKQIQNNLYEIAREYNISVDYLQYMLNPNIYNADVVEKGTLINVPFKPFKEKQSIEKLFPVYAKALRKMYNKDGDILIQGNVFPKSFKGIRYEEFMHSITAMEHNFSNIPDLKSMKNLKLLIEKVLAPLKEKYGNKLEIGSGYRGPRLNKEVGGVRNSQHAKGQAVDIQVKNVKPAELYKWCKENLEYDQLILEYNTWVHISYRNDGKNRMQAFEQN